MENNMNKGLFYFLTILVCAFLSWLSTGHNAPDAYNAIAHHMEGKF
jgi:hypothetical protein